MSSPALPTIDQLLANKENEPPVRFDMQCKYYFLTYPRCDLEKEAVRDALGGMPTLEGWIIGREAHEDGAPHIHCYLQFSRPKRIRDARAFDIGGFHCNIQRCRDRVATQQYVTKGDDYIANMDLIKGKRTWKEIIEGSRDAKEFLATLEDHDPRAVVLNLERIQTYAKWKFGAQQLPAFELSQDFGAFVVPAELNSWYEDNVINRGNWVYGPPALEGGPSPLLSFPPMPIDFF